MNRKVSIIINSEIIDFIARIVSNSNCLINKVLYKEEKESFIKELANAYQNQANDPDFQEEIYVWDITANDGLDA